MRFIGKTFYQAPLIEAENFLVEVYECEKCGNRQPVKRDKCAKCEVNKNE